MTDAIYNVLLVLCELCLLAAGWSRPRWLWLSALQPITAAGIALGCGEGSFGAMRLLAYGVFLHAPVLALVVGIRLRALSRMWATVAILSAVALTAIGIDAFLVEPHALQVTHVRLRSSKLKRPLRVALVADLQMRTFGDYERAALRRTLAERPELIVLAGDYVQADDRRSQHRISAELGRYLASIHFAAPLGVFAVQGNMERRGWEATFEPIHAVTFPKTASVTTGELQITGLTLADSFDPELTVASSSRFHIAFGHAPDFARGDVAADLLLAGHTHGGQVRLPWFGPLITYSSVPRGWAAGVTELDRGRTLIVSRGIGLERGNAPPLRFLCRPEIIVVQIDPAQP